LRKKIKLIEGGAKDTKPAAFRGDLRLLSCLSSVIQDHRTRGNPKDARSSDATSRRNPFLGELKNTVDASGKMLVDRIQCGMNFSIVVFINAIETGFSR
jgi:hypothetical protein